MLQLPDELLIRILLLVEKPFALLNSCKRLYNIGQESLVKAEWLFGRYGQPEIESNEYPLHALSPQVMNSLQRISPLNFPKLLQLSINNHRHELVDFIVSTHNLSDFSSESLENVLYFAAEHGHLEIIKRLQDQIDLHSSQDFAFCLTAIQGHIHVAEYLSSNGTDVHAWQDTAFCFAIQQRQLQMMEWLYEKGVNVDTKDGYGIWTASTDGWLEGVTWLLERGANVSLRNEEAITSALREGHLFIAEILSACKGVDKTCIEIEKMKLETVSV